MANDLNRCEFIGRLGKDVETRYMTDGKAVANFSIAVGSQWKSKAGEKRDATEWVNLVAYEKLAEICQTYLKKGSQIYVSGKMKTRKWEKDGVTRYSTEIIVNELQMLGSKSQGESEPKAAQSAQSGNGNHDDFDSDIPF